MSTPVIPSATLEFYRGIPSSVLTDSMLRLKVGSWLDDVTPVGPKNVSGRARTLQFGVKTGVRSTSHSIYTFAESFEDGDVMLISARDTLGWLFGDNVVDFCINCGVAGIVTDGRVRDIEQITASPLPVFCRGVAARSFKPDVEVVAVDVPIEIAGGYVVPGDLVVGDRDGVAVAPHAAIEALIQEAEEIVQLELEQTKAIAERKSVKEIRGIGDRKGVRKGPEFRPAPRT